MEALENLDLGAHLAHQDWTAKLENKVLQVFQVSLEIVERKENMEIWDLLA